MCRSFEPRSLIGSNFTGEILTRMRCPMMKPRPPPTFTTQARLGRDRISLPMAFSSLHLRCELVLQIVPTASLTVELPARGALLLKCATNDSSSYFTVHTAFPRNNDSLSPE